VASDDKENDLKIEIWTPDVSDEEFYSRVMLTTMLVLKLLKDELEDK
jgi:hypothetical protein